MMSDFFSTRSSRHQKKMLKYLRYVFNDHFVLVCLFLLGGIGFYYSEWVRTVPAGAGWGKVLCLLIWMIAVTFGKLATLTEEADIVFLLPKELQMNGYLKKAKIHSLVLPFFLLILAGGFMMPLAVVSTQGEFSDFFFYLPILWLLKASEMDVQQVALYRFRKSSGFFWKSLWYLVVILTLGSALFLFPILGLALAVIQEIFFLIVFRSFLPKERLDWERMVALEKKRIYRIYQFINLFTDVPEVSAKVRRRKYLDPLFKLISFKQENTYLYLFSRRMIRGSEFSGLYVRLVILGTILSYLFQDVYVASGLGILFLYLIGFQLLPLYDQFQYMVLTQLYPVKIKDKQQALQKIIFSLLLIAAFFFGLGAALSTQAQQWVPLAGEVLFVGLFVLFYVPTRIKKMSGE